MCLLATVLKLNLTTLWANATDGKLTFFLIYPRKQALKKPFELPPDLRELSKPVFWGKLPSTKFALHASR